MSIKSKHIGFTLIEVLVGMVIIAVALAATSRAAGHAIDISNEMKNRVIADLVARIDWKCIRQGMTG